MAVAQPSTERQATAEAPPFDRRSLNVPNLITLSRLVLAIVLFVLIDVGGWWRTATWVFVVAALTDYIDGWLARRSGQITTLGRILDPFVDKIIICGAFIFLLAKPASGVTGWITFVIVAREMFITSLRSFLEQRGQDFSAKWSGKIKMVLQCLAVPMCLLSLSPEFLGSLPEYLRDGGFVRLRDVVLWATVAVTVYSGVEYTWRAFRMLSGGADR
jgi:CDP-diacylglycerol--glycerol-3-phosphate 3-phosphatidyltransferase